MGVYQKYPFVTGYLDLVKTEFLNSARVKCENTPRLKEALEAEIENVLDGYKKREAAVSVIELESECKEE